jgi:hypothetical protein
MSCEDDDVTSGDDIVSILMPAGSWAPMDGGMANAAQQAIDDYDHERAEICPAIRRSGWAQVPWVDGKWPPMDQEIAISLTRSQWKIIRVDAPDSRPVYVEIGDAESGRSSDETVAIIDNNL